MRSERRWLLRLLAVLSVFALVVAACGGDDDDDAGGTDDTEPSGDVQQGGDIVVAAEQELTSFNQNTSADNLLWGGMIVRLIWPQTYYQTPDLQLTPGFILDGEAEVVSEDPFTVEWKLRDEAVWSDGTPVSSDDLEYYWQSCNGAIDEGEPTTEVEGETVTALDCVSTDGYDKVTEFEKVDGKTARLTFDSKIAEYKQLFSNPMPPAHIAREQGPDAWAKAFVNDPVVSAGPYQLKEWDKGASLTLERNPEFYDEPANLDTITFRFFAESGAIPQALENAEVDLIYPQPQLDLVDQVGALSGVTSEMTFGVNWEHLTFNTRNEYLAKVEVRQAIAKCVDRQSLVDTLMKPFSDEAAVLNNRIFMPNQAEYVDNGGDYAERDVDGAKALLEEAGYAEGDVALRVATTGGNQLREDTEELLIAQLEECGIALTIDNRPGSDVFDVIFGGEATAGDWDIALFAWVATVTPAISSAPVYGTGQGNNAGAFSDPDLDALFDKAIAELDADARAELLNEADVMMWEGMPDLPLYQKPTYIAYEDQYANIVDNTTSEGFTWNAHLWGTTG